LSFWHIYEDAIRDIAVISMGKRSEYKYDWSTYSSSHSVSSLKDGNADPILMEDRGTPQASNSCADNTDMRWIMSSSTISAGSGSAGSIENGICNARAARYLLFISGSHAKVFLRVFPGTWLVHYWVVSS